MLWDELSYVDLHESAHFALDQLLPNQLEVPMVLLEGWAECHSGRVFPDTTWRLAWKSRKDGQWLSLRELTSPHWYRDGTEPVHWQGRVLVDYFLRQFGPQKFLELCRTCRQATFADDLERVLGVNIDALDRAYQQDLAEQGPPDRRFLLSATLGHAVDPSQWRRFVDDYWAGVERLRNSFRQSSVMMVQTYKTVDQDGKEETSQRRFEYYRDNDREAAIHFSRFADVVTPDYIFMLDREKDDQPWQITHYQAQGPKKTFDLWTVVPSDPWFLRDALEPLQSRDHPRGLTITAIQSRDANSPRTRVFYEREPDSGSSSHGERGWWDLDPKRDYAVVESTSEDFDESGAVTYSMNTTVQYEIVEGHLVPQRVHRESKSPDETSSETIGTIESCRFEAPPPKVFELATYGDLHPKPPAVKPTNRRGIVPWIAGGCSLLALAMAGLQMRGRSRVGSLSRDPSGTPALDGQATSPPAETETHTDPHR